MRQFGGPIMKMSLVSFPHLDIEEMAIFLSAHLDPVLLESELVHDLLEIFEMFLGGVGMTLADLSLFLSEVDPILEHLVLLPVPRDLILVFFGREM
jgi:hypothetical protein